MYGMQCFLAMSCSPISARCNLRVNISPRQASMSRDETVMLISFVLRENGRFRVDTSIASDGNLSIRSTAVDIVKRISALTELVIDSCFVDHCLHGMSLPKP